MLLYSDIYIYSKNFILNVDAYLLPFIPAFMSGSNPLPFH